MRACGPIAVYVGIDQPSLPAWLLEIAQHFRPTAEMALATAKHGLRWTAGRTGLPFVVVAALAAVVGWRVARRTWHIALELALAVTALLLAARLGWIRW